MLCSNYALINKYINPLKVYNLLITNRSSCFTINILGQYDSYPLIDRTFQNKEKNIRPYNKSKQYFIIF